VRRRKPREQKGLRPMNNEATDTTKPPPLRNRARTSRGELAPRRGRQPEEGHEGPSNRQGCQSQGRQEAAKARQHRKPRAARRGQGAKIIEMIGRARGDPGRDHEGHRLAGPQRRGFISTAAKKNRIKIESSKRSGDRVHKTPEAFHLPGRRRFQLRRRSCCSLRVRSSDQSATPPRLLAPATAW
jgi:hypothetical protein